MMITESNYPILWKALYQVAVQHTEMPACPADEETTFSLDYPERAIASVDSALCSLSEGDLLLMCDLGDHARHMATQSPELRRARSMLRVFAILAHEVDD